MRIYRAIVSFPDKETAEDVAERITDKLGYICVVEERARSEQEIRNRINAIKMDLENPEKAHVKPKAMAAMLPYLHALEWVLEKPAPQQSPEQRKERR